MECQQRVVVVRELAPQSRISSDERDMRWINGIVVVDNGRWVCQWRVVVAKEPVLRLAFPAKREMCRCVNWVWW